MIELRGVGKTYGGAVAVHPTSLTVEPGKTTVLIGPSGCGKSTLLRLIIGLIEPSCGAVLFRGTAIVSAPDPASPTGAASRPSDHTLIELRRRMGYVIQDGGLFPHLTAEENVTLLARHVGWEAARVRPRLAELCELTRFPQAGLARYPVELSGGQRQRVGLMRALMLGPDVLLLDEPLGALDPMVRADLQTDLKAIFARLGQTVILVTHDMGEAGYLGATIVLMRDGAIVQKGSLDDLRDRPDAPYVTEFLSAQRSLVQL